MKKLIYFTLLIGGMFISQSSKAQVSVNINIGSQPLWGPVGYDYVRYYYMPEIDVYYNVVSRKYTYFHGNRWVTKSKLPGHYRNFDIYRTYKVVINEHNPWKYHGRHRQHYGHYGRSYNHHQVVLRDARTPQRGSRHVAERRSPSRDMKYHKKMEKEYKKMEKEHKRHKHDNRR